MALMLKFVSFFITFCCILTIEARQTEAQEADQVIVVIDAGSTHTSFYLFQLLGNISQIASCSVEGGGLDQFAGAAYEVPGYLAGCLLLLSAGLPAETVQSQTPVYLGATAGMRLLYQQDFEAAEAIMEAVRETLAASGFYFEADFASVLSGEEEGFYSLIAVNLLASENGVLGNGSLALGSLDMGGASAQAAFPCLDQSADCYHVEVLGQPQYVYSQSHSCYGLQEAMKRYVAFLIIDAISSGSNPEEAMNPCLHLTPKDSWLTEFPSIKSEIFSGPCTELNTGLLGGAAAILDDLPDDFRFRHVPAFQSTASCHLSVARIFNNCSQVFSNPEDNCFSLGLSLTELPYLAMSSYFWEFGLLLGAETLDLAEAESRIEALCQQQQSLEDDNQTNCFLVSYVFLMLLEGYGLDSDSFEKVHFVEKIGESEVSWALGLAATKFSRG